MLKSISLLKDLHNKTVLLRIDSDVDIQNGKISDDTRLASSLKTIRYVLENNGNVIILGHSGRPEGKKDTQYSLEPVAKWFAHHFKGHIKPKEFGTFQGWEITPHLSILENLRFYQEEEKNTNEFAQSLASLGECFVNEAFAVSHRDHASITGIPKYIPSYAGFHLQKEVETLSNIMKNPKRPLGVLIGGAKIETKLPAVTNMHTVAEYVLVGGKISQENKILVHEQHEKITSRKSALLVSENTPDGESITDRDTENFIQIINLCKTIVWNGPFGKMGNTNTEENTLKIAKAIINSGAYSVLGGGDSIALLSRHNLLSKFSFVSTGGGAMLEFLAGKTLPGIKTLEC